MSVSSDVDLDSLFKKYRIISPIGPSGWKEAGNALIGKKEYNGAVKAYSKGLEIGTNGKQDLLCILLSNRSQAYLGLNEFVLALMDAEEALRADPKHVKSYFRKGKALFELERYEEACDAFKQSDSESKMIQTCLDHIEQSKKGNYNWSMLVQKSIEDSETIHEVANYFHENVSVEQVEGHGRGLVAKQALEKGTLILVEKSCVLVTPSTMLAKKKAPGDIAIQTLGELVDKKTKIRDFVVTLDLGSESEIEKGEESLKKDKHAYLKQAIAMNGFGWWDGTKCNIQQRPQDHGFGLWPKACMLNHSCVPNCCYVFLGNVLIVRTACDIAEGEELMISYLSAHDTLEERDAKLKRRGFRCECLLCTKQREVDWESDYASARMSVFREYGEGKVIHNTLTWHAMIKLANEIDDLNVSGVVARVVGGLSCDRAKDYLKAIEIWEEAWTLQTSQPLMASLWTEEVNFCVQAIFAGIMTQNKEVAEAWIPRLDSALERMYPKEIVQGLGNYVIVSFRTKKQQEEQGGPSLQSMMGF